MWSETVAILTGAALVIAVIFGVGAMVRTSGEHGAQATGDADPSDIPGVIAPPPLISSRSWLRLRSSRR